MCLLEKVVAYAEENRPFLNELKELVAIPSVSSSSEHKQDVKGVPNSSGMPWK